MTNGSSIGNYLTSSFLCVDIERVGGTAFGIVTFGEREVFLDRRVVLARGSVGSLSHADDMTPTALSRQAGFSTLSIEADENGRLASSRSFRFADGLGGGARRRREQQTASYQGRPPGSNEMVAPNPRRHRGAKVEMVMSTYIERERQDEGYDGWG